MNYRNDDVCELMCDDEGGWNDDFLTVVLLTKGREIGRLHLHLYPRPTLFLADIFIGIRDSAVGVLRTAGRQLDSTAESARYRRRGLGTAILNWLKTESASRGFETIEGKLSPVDLKDEPNLGKFYSGLGFTVDEAAGTIFCSLCGCQEQKRLGP